MILDRIVEDKRVYVEEAKKRCPLGQLMRENGRSRRSLMASIGSREVAVITEIKRRSPSGGDMMCGYGLTELASMYEANGSAGISVLTDEKYFGGSVEDLLAVRKETMLPVLRKDFIIDEYQIFEAKAYGADVILLIAAILDDATIAHFLALAHDLGLEVLLESHTEDELERSIKSGARLIGINNRNLDTLKTDLNTSIRLMSMVPDDRVVISESGISSSSDVKRLLDVGAGGFLIGESLLKSDNPGQKLAELMNVPK